MSGDFIRQIRKSPADQHRWAVWYKSIYPKLYYAAFRLTNGNAEAARDLTQETFARFLGYRAIERVTNDQHALSFLIKTCRNLAIDRNARVHEVPLEDLEEAESIATPELSTESTIDIERMLKALNPEDRQLMQWARDGVSVSDIARKLGVSYTAAGVRLHRLRKQLRETHS